MTQRRARLTATLVLATIALVSTSPTLAARPGAVSLKTVNLRASDLPAGYKTSIAKAMSASEAASSTSASSSAVQRHGYLSGYEAEFTHPIKNGKTIVGSFTLLFRSVADATWMYPYELRSLSTTTKATHVSADTVGNVSAMYHVVTGGGKNAAAGYGLVFRRGTIVAGLAIYGTGPSYGSVSQILGLGKIVDKRIQSLK
jgi:hypothetical protein